MENISTTCEFLLQISQNHSPNRVCPPSKVSHCSSVTRIRNPRRLFIAKGKFLGVLMRRVFSTEDKYFLPFEEPRIRGVTVHVARYTVAKMSPACVLGWLNTQATIERHVARILASARFHYYTHAVVYS